MNRFWLATFVLALAPLGACSSADPVTESAEQVPEQPVTGTDPAGSPSTDAGPTGDGGAPAAADAGAEPSADAGFSGDAGVPSDGGTPTACTTSEIASECVATKAWTFTSEAPEYCSCLIERWTASGKTCEQMRLTAYRPLYLDNAICSCAERFRPWCDVTPYSRKQVVCVARSKGYHLEYYLNRFQMDEGPTARTSCVAWKLNDPAGPRAIGPVQFLDAGSTEAAEGRCSFDLDGQPVTFVRSEEALPGDTSTPVHMGFVTVKTGTTTWTLGDADPAAGLKGECSERLFNTDAP